MGVAIVAVMVALFSVPVATAHAEEYIDFTSVENDGQFTITPARTELDVVPGETYTINYEVINHSGEEVTFVNNVVDLRGAENPSSFVEEINDAKFGAKGWLQPEIDEFTLKHGQMVKFDLTVTPPPDPPVGSNYAALRIQAEPDEEQTEGLNQRFVGISQVLLNVPGNIERGGQITETSVSDSFFFRESLLGGGSSFARFSAIYENSGNVTDTASGEIVVTSMFGNEVERYEIPPTQIIRGDDRTFTHLWTDPPMFGYFTTEIELTTDAGTFTESFEPIIILPPWWWFVAAALAVGVPAFFWWRNSRIDWEAYLDDEFDEDWDEAYDQDDF